MNAQEESRSWSLHCLNQSRGPRLLRRPGGAHEALSETVNGLVVGALDVRVRAENSLSQSSGLTVNLSLLIGTIARLMPQMANQVGNMLDQRPAQGHIQELVASADGQEGQIDIEGSLQECHF